MHFGRHKPLSQAPFLRSNFDPLASLLTVAFDSGEATWFRTSLDKDGRLEPPLPGIPLTLVFAGTAVVVVVGAHGTVALRPLLALTPVPVLAAPLLSADPRGLGSVTEERNNMDQ